MLRNSWDSHSLKVILIYITCFHILPYFYLVSLFLSPVFVIEKWPPGECGSYFTLSPTAYFLFSSIDRPIQCVFASLPLNCI